MSLEAIGFEAMNVGSDKDNVPTRVTGAIVRPCLDLSVCPKSVSLSSTVDREASPARGRLVAKILLSSKGR